MIPVGLAAWAAKFSWGGALSAAWGFVRKNLVPILIVCTLAFTHYKTYSWGAEGVREEFAEAHAAQLEKELKLKEKEVVVNAKKSEETTVRVTRSNTRAEVAKEKADAYVQENPLTPDCLITDDDARVLNSVDSGDGL
jgi:hypothetical protein